MAIKSDWKQTFKVPAPDDTALKVYLQNGAKRLADRDLPMGAKLYPIDVARGEWVLEPSELKFLDVSIRPKAFIHIATSPGRMLITTRDVEVQGSKQIEELGLQDRYDIDVNVEVVEANPTSFTASCTLDLKVDVPFPFSLTPMPILETAGKGVMEVVLSTLMRAFANLIISDFKTGELPQIAA